MANLLITGGAGFIGSHTCLVLLQAGHSIVVLDDFSNSSPRSLERVLEIATTCSTDIGSLIQVHGDVRDFSTLEKLFVERESIGQPFDAVIHFAGLKSVAESLEKPLLYWDVNVVGSRNLLTVMDSHSCRTIVFSSSATLYGSSSSSPIPETAPIRPINPYGSTKAAVEMLLADLVGCSPGEVSQETSKNGWSIARLRYFNPVGAHSSGHIGEDPFGLPNNLFPFISQVAVKRRDLLKVFGGDWPTPDGTGIRDYIHVMDLAEGHCAALNCLFGRPGQLLTLNLGTGKGYSVLEVVKAFEKASGLKVAYELVDRRPGDVAATIADPTLAYKRIGWRSKRGLMDMCRDAWLWQRANPNGFDPLVVK